MSNHFICILCCRHVDRKFGYYNIGDTSIDSSKKTIKNILIHLSKCIKTTCFFEDNSSVCCKCHEKIAEYDQIMVQLLFHQKSLSSMLESSIQFFNEIKTKPCDVSIEEDCIVKTEFESSCNNISIKKDGDDAGDMDGDDAGDMDGDDAGDMDGDDAGDMDNYDSDSTENDMEQEQYHQISSFECTLCGKRVKTKTSLQRHLEGHANAVKCNICGALRKDEEYLELHMNVHEGKTENDCRFCPKRYSRRANVIRHMHLHWDKKKFQCEKCGLRFSQANILYNHKLIHEAEEQPLICQICDQTFKSRKTFKHHMVTHQEDRPRHPCEICGKQFTEKYTLKMHLKTHTAGGDEELELPKKGSTQTKKFTCIICGKGFSTMESLDSHKVKDHDVISTEGVFLNLF